MSFPWPKTNRDSPLPMMYDIQESHLWLNKCPPWSDPKFHFWPFHLRLLSLAQISFLIITQMRHPLPGDRDLQESWTWHVDENQQQPAQEVGTTEVSLPKKKQPTPRCLPKDTCPSESHHCSSLLCVQTCASDSTGNAMERRSHVLSGLGLFLKL